MAARYPESTPHRSFAGCPRSAQHRIQPVLAPPRRPNFGTAGRPISLYANVFKLQVPRNQFVYQYDVAIVPPKCPAHVNHQVIDALINKYNEKDEKIFNGMRPAYDGQKSIFSRERLPIGKDGVTLNVSLPDEGGGRDRQFKVTVKYATTINLSELMDFLHGRLSSNQASPREGLRSLDIILRQQPSLHYMAVGHSFYPPPGELNKPLPLGGGCEAWFGMYQAVRPSQWKVLLVNIDVTSKAFYQEQEVMQLLCDTLEKRLDEVSRRGFRLERRLLDSFCATIKGLKVATTHVGGIKRKYTVTGLSPESASSLRFSVTDDKTGTTSWTTVEAYFRDRYKLNLKYPHLPCLVVGRNKFLPMEVCKLYPCVKQKLSERQLSVHARGTVRPAWERQKNILNWVNECHDKSDYYLRNEFGMSVSKEMERVEGRVLDPPTLQLGGESRKKQVTPHDGQWNMRGNTFYSGIEVQSWALFCYLPTQRCNASILRTFSQQLMLFSGKAGMVIKNNPCCVDYIQEQDTSRAFDRVQRTYQDLQFILAVIPNTGNKLIYQQVKQVGDTIFGVATQCVQFKHVLSPKAQVCSNIAMKINAKLGGVNHVINLDTKAPILREPVVVFGADVTHPPAGDSTTPSIAAVVASLDPNATRYCAAVRVQNSRQEIIQDLATMVKELLLQFYRKTHMKPRKIIFYRDGVSDGHFHQVLMMEVRAVQEACMMLEKGFQPGITFVIVQKRHHVRLFPADRRDACGKPGNIPPGTTVDKGITHPFEFDFYLCSHFGSQGTSRPTHYHVIYDDNGFNADSLQQLTYQLCYTFARCPKSVSMPAPAYYAHLAAFRARYHLAYKTRGGSALADFQSCAKAVKVHQTMESGMYFA